MFHTCLDRLEELLGIPTLTSMADKNNAMKKWQRGSNWLGIVSTIENYDIYGYATASSIKILAMIERHTNSHTDSGQSSGGGGDNIIFPLFMTSDTTSQATTATSFSKETDIKLLFVSFSFGIFHLVCLTFLFY